MQTETVKKNLQTISSLYPCIEGLKNQWSTNPEDFALSLWQFFHENWQTRELRIIYRDLATNQTEGKRPQLTYKSFFGTEEPTADNEHKAIDLVMNEYTPLECPYQVVFCDEDKGEVVVAGQVEESPVLVMAKLEDFSPLQNALAQGLFSGLSSSGPVEADLGETVNPGPQPA